MDAQPEARSWQISQRWQSYEGEIRSSILRTLLVAAFYAIQLVHHFVFAEDTEANLAFHRQITVLCMGWLLASLAVLVALRQRFFPVWLKFAVSAFDLALLTVGAAIGSGPHSPLVYCYALIVALAGLRASLPLVWFVTLAAMACYVGLVGQADDHWFDPQHVVPPVEQLVVLGALAATGIVVGQIVRSYRSLAESYVERLEHLSKIVSREASDV